MEPNQKTKKKSKKNTEAEIRQFTPGVLPKYSNYYFERKISGREKRIVFEVIVVWGLFLLILTLEMHNLPLNLLLFPAIGILFYEIFLEKKIRKIQMKLGYSLEPDGIRIIGIFGPGKLYSYQFVRQAVEKDRIWFNTYAMVLPCQAFTLRFHYEIGDSAAFKQVTSCLALLEQRTGQKLPNLTRSFTKQMDRQYFYKRKMIQSGITLLIITGLFFLLVRTVHGDVGVLAGPGIALLAFFYLLWYEMWKNALFLFRVQKELDEEFPERKKGFWTERHIIWLTAGFTAVLLVLNALAATGF